MDSKQCPDLHGLSVGASDGQIKSNQINQIKSRDCDCDQEKMFLAFSRSKSPKDRRNELNKSSLSAKWNAFHVWQSVFDSISSRKVNVSEFYIISVHEIKKNSAKER